MTNLWEDKHGNRSLHAVMMEMKPVNLHWLFVCFKAFFTTSNAYIGC
jgi:hypothetical protein